MAIKKQKKEAPSSLLGVVLNNPKIVAGLVKPLLPLAQEIAKDILKDQIKPQQKKVTRKSSKKKATRKATKKLDSKHDRCKCGTVKLKTSKYCRKCSDKKRRRK